MKKLYRKGADKERKIVKTFRDNGHLAFRSAGSHSPIDVFALNIEKKEIYLIQSKSDKMSEASKKNILDSIIKYEGTYIVKVVVK
jgi:Holliday junction resolvase